MSGYLNEVYKGDDPKAKSSKPSGSVKVKRKVLKSGGRSNKITDVGKINKEMEKELTINPIAH